MTERIIRIEECNNVLYSNISLGTNVIVGRDFRTNEWWNDIPDIINDELHPLT